MPLDKAAAAEALKADDSLKAAVSLDRVKVLGLQYDPASEITRVYIAYGQADGNGNFVEKYREELAFGKEEFSLDLSLLPDALKARNILA